MAKTGTKLEQERQEDVCAAIAASVLGARFRRRDENGGQQIYDFDLDFNGAVEALEVCSFTDATVREQWQALGALDVVATSLPSSWTIGVGRGVRVKGLPVRAEQHLAVFERHGHLRFIADEHYTLPRRRATRPCCGVGGADRARRRRRVACAEYPESRRV
jgi:hypothetical protein